MFDSNDVFDVVVSFVWVLVFVYMFECVVVYVLVCVFVCAFVFVCVFVNVCVLVFVCSLACVGVSVMHFHLRRQVCLRVRLCVHVSSTCLSVCKFSLTVAATGPFRLRFHFNAVHVFAFVCV